MKIKTGKLLYKLIHISNKRNEGIAIILSLSFLALVSILAITFLFISTVDRKAAKNNNDLTSARILARSVVNRALVAMETYSGDLNNLTSYYTGNAGSTSTMVEDESLSNLLITNVNGIDFYTDTTYNDSQLPPTWQYVKINDGQNDRIIGRIAYAVADVPSSSGWIMISAAVDDGKYAPGKNDGVTEYGSPAAIQSAITHPPYTGIDKNGNYILGRKGVDVSEISLNSLSFLTETHLRKMSSYKAIPGGTMPATGWGSADAFFSALKIKEADKAEFLKYFSFGNPEDKEAFWIDSVQNVGIKDDNELYHRFDLTRSNWNSITVDSMLSSPILYTNAYSEGTVTSISWLNNWQSPGEMGSLTACKKQVIANLIDYNDTDDIATTDDPDNPTYVGLEAVPYANEVYLEIPGSITKTELSVPELVSYEQPYSDPDMEADSDAGLLINYYDSNNYSGEIYYKYEFTIDKPKLVLELINIYSGTGVIPTNANVKLSIDYLFGDKDKPGEVEQLDEEHDFSFAPSTWYEISDDEYEYLDKYFDNSFPKTITVIDEEYLGNPVLYAFVNHIKVKITNSNNGDFYDYSYVVDSAQPDTRVIVDGIGSYTFPLSYQVQDPRQNLFDTDWEQQSSNSISYIIDDNLDRDDLSKNSNYPTNIDRDNHSDTMDYEDYSAQPYDLSTAFIRNAPMQSPWELGAIHRGTKWQTINLKKYKNPSSYIGTGGGGNYSDGDANILNQIKMTSETTNLGKINLNVTLPSILKLLFHAIYTHSGYEIPGTQDAIDPYLDFQVTPSDAETLDTAVRNYTTNTQQFKTRAEVVNSTTLFSDNTLDPSNLQQSDDATKEEIIGKFINLTKADAIITAQLYIIAVAQIIQDVGGVTVKKDVDNDGVIGTADESAIGIDINGDGDINDTINETITNTQIGIYDQYADQITATQKMLIIIYKTPNDQYRIRRLEYIID